MPEMVSAKVDYFDPKSGTFDGGINKDVGQLLMDHDFDCNVLRPYKMTHEDRRTFVTMNEYDTKQGKMVPTPKLIANTPATLTHEQWKYFDDVMVLETRNRLQIVQDLRSAGLVRNIPNALGKTSIVTKKRTNAGFATISMDPSQESYRDRPQVDEVIMPLPVIHAMFSFNIRELAEAKNSQIPLDPTMVECCTFEIMDLAEQLVLGTSSTFTYGGGTIYGLRNFPDRLTKTMTLPTDPSWTPKTLIAEVLDMRQALADNQFRAPVMLYGSPAWEPYLDADYSDAKGTNTLRQRLMMIDRVMGFKSLDHLTGYQMIMLEMKNRTVKLIQGIPLTIFEWPEGGGMTRWWKMMTMINPQFLSNTNGDCGINHGTAA